MLTGSGGMPNLVLLIAGVVLALAGGAAIRWREGVAEYLRDLREQFFGTAESARTADKRPLAIWLPVAAGVILIGLGIIGAAGGLFATLPPPGTPRV